MCNQKRFFGHLSCHFLLISLLIFSFLVTPVKADFVPSVENEIYVLVNQERDSMGLPPLVPETRLAIMARQHSEEMAILGYFDHDSPVPGFETLSDRASQANSGMLGDLSGRRLFGIVQLNGSDADRSKTARKGGALLCGGKGEPEA